MKITFFLLMLFLFPVLTMANDISTPDPVLERGFHFPECPGTPNCVSSLAKDPAKRVEPFPVKRTPARSMESLAVTIKSMPRATIFKTSPDMIQAEFRSLLGFVDDVLFVVSPDEEVIHVRSASRKGSWDLGVNRRRVEKIRAMYLGDGE